MYLLELKGGGVEGAWASFTILSSLMKPIFTAKLRCPVIDVLLHNMYTTFLTGFLNILVDSSEVFADGGLDHLCAKYN